MKSFKEIRAGNSLQELSDFGKAFAAARKAHGGPGGMFTWKGKDYQTNIKGEPYVKNPKRIPGTGSNFTKKPDMPPARPSKVSKSEPKISTPKASGVKDVAPISKDKSPPKGPGGDKPLVKTTTKTAKLGKYNAPKGPGGDQPLPKTKANNTVKDVAPLGKSKLKFKAPTGPGGDKPLPKSTKPNVEIKPQNKKQDTKAFDKLMDIFRKSREIKRKRRSGGVDV